MKISPEKMYSQKKKIVLNFQFHLTKIFLESSVLFYHEIPLISIYLIMVTNSKNKFHDTLLIFIY